MKAYHENYLRLAKNNLANAFQYLLLKINLDKKLLLSIFVNSKYAKLFEKGDPNVIAGMSGVELIDNILYEYIDNYEPIKNYYCNIEKRTKEYWIGYYLAEYQWERSISFKKIFEKITFDELSKMYKIYHEMDISRFIETLDERIFGEREFSKLKIIRENRGISQSKLAKLSHVSIRSIQMYEQNKNDIRKAENNALNSLCQVLGCNVDELTGQPGFFK